MNFTPILKLSIFGSKVQEQNTTFDGRQPLMEDNSQCLSLFYSVSVSLFLCPCDYVSRGQPNPNNSAESEYIRNRIVPFLINRIGNKTIRIRFLISRIGICSIRIRFLINRIGICSIPYKPNINQIFEMVKTIINQM